MARRLRLKGVLLLLLVAGLVYVVNPPRDTLVLGLDLQGGIHLVMRVHTEDAVRVLTDETPSSSPRTSTTRKSTSRTSKPKDRDNSPS